MNQKHWKPRNIFKIQPLYKYRKQVLPWPSVQCNHRALPMTPNRFLGKIVRMQDQQRAAHVPAAHGTHLVRACTAVCWDDECIAWNGIHGRPSQRGNLETIANRRRGEVWSQCNLHKIQMVNQWFLIIAHTLSRTFRIYLSGSLTHPPVVECYPRDSHSCRWATGIRGYVHGTRAFCTIWSNC